MTNKNIVQAISEELGLTHQETRQIVQKTLDAIVNTLVEEGRVELRNFGVFEVRWRKARMARNPRTGEKLSVPRRCAVSFKPGQVMERRVSLRPAFNDVELTKYRKSYHPSLQGASPMSRSAKSHVYPLIGAAVLVILIVTAACTTSQPPLAATVVASATADKTKGDKEETAAQTSQSVEEKPAPGKQGTANLPLSRVVLFSSGVGYFEHNGQVTDNAKVELKFKVKDINDLLKSMVVQDFDGGHISTVGLARTTPSTCARQLRDEPQR